MCVQQYKYNSAKRSEAAEAVLLPALAHLARTTAQGLSRALLPVGHFRIRSGGVCARTGRFKRRVLLMMNHTMLNARRSCSWFFFLMSRKKCAEGAVHGPKVDDSHLTTHNQPATPRLRSVECSPSLLHSKQICHCLLPVSSRFSSEFRKVLENFGSRNT